MENLKKTPLNKVHRDLGGKMVDFGGWDMPVQYSGVIAFFFLPLFLILLVSIWYTLD